MSRTDDLPFSPDGNGEASPEDFFRGIVWHVMMTLRVAQPATVVKWNPPVRTGPIQRPPTVDLKMDFKYRRAVDVEAEVNTAKGETVSDESWGLRAEGEWPTFRFCPIVSFGPPAFNIRGPIAVGTTGLWVVVDRSLDEWLNNGGPLAPATADKHDFNDGFFIPTAYHGKNTPEVSADVHQLGPDDGSAGLEIATATDKSVRVFTDGPTATVDAATTVKLGEAAAEAITKAESLISAIDTMLAAGVPVANDGGANLLATMTVAWNGVKNSIKATKGRVE